MTQLFAEIKDFKLIYTNEEIIAYQFRFGEAEEWSTTFDLFKRNIPLAQRKPLPDRNWLWEVKHNANNRMILSKLFDNFEQCWQIANSQIRMF